MSTVQDLENNLVIFNFDLQRFDDEEDSGSDGSDSDSGSDSEVAQWNFDGERAIYSTSTEIFVTIEGVISAEGLSDPVDNVVTVSASSLSQNATVTISDGYRLALGTDVTTASLPTITKDWAPSGNNAVCTVSSTTAGYKLEDNQITYEEASAGGSLTVRLHRRLRQAYSPALRLQPLLYPAKTPPKQ